MAAAPAFVGHATCDAQPWVNNLVYPTVNSFHQNVAGHYAYAVLTAPALFGTSVARSDARPLPEVAGPAPRRPLGRWADRGYGCPT